MNCGLGYGAFPIVMRMSLHVVVCRCNLCLCSCETRARSPSLIKFKESERTDFQAYLVYIHMRPVNFCSIEHEGTLQGCSIFRSQRTCHTERSRCTSTSQSSSQSCFLSAGYLPGLIRCSASHVLTCVSRDTIVAQRAMTIVRLKYQIFAKKVKGCQWTWL